MFGYLKTKQELRDLRREYSALVDEYAGETAERWKAEDRAQKMETAVNAAIGTHVSMPYREDLIQGISFPVTFSVFALKELSKRMDEDVLVEAIDNQVRRKIKELIATPRVRNMTR